MAMSKGLKIGLAVGIPVLVIGTVGIIVVIQNQKKKEKQRADFLAKYSSGANTVTYTDPATNQTTTKDKSKMSLAEILALIKAGVDIYNTTQTQPQPPTES